MKSIEEDGQASLENSAGDSAKELSRELADPVNVSPEVFVEHLNAAIRGHFAYQPGILIKLVDVPKSTYMGLEFIGKGAKDIYLQIRPEVMKRYRPEPIIFFD